MDGKLQVEKVRSAPELVAQTQVRKREAGLERERKITGVVHEDAGGGGKHARILGHGGFFHS